MNKLLLVDGHNLLFQMFFGMPSRILNEDGKAIHGTIGFVGLVVPHMARMLAGPNHRRLLPASLFFGAIFLMLADLVGRTLLSPIELPIGVITSLVGSVLFILIFNRTRKGR